MLARLRLQARFRFQVEHVLPQVVHLGLVELGRQRRVGEILVDLVDDVEARDHGGEEGGVDGAAEVGQQGALFVGRAGRFFDGEVAFERLLDVLSVSAVGQGDADEVGACEGRGWDMKPDGLELGPLRRLLVS